MKDSRYKRWDERLANAWRRFPSPARPSKEEVSIFRKYLMFHYFEKRRRLKILILGSTPEFRDMCNKDHFEVYCMDINKETYWALSLLIKQKNKQEKLINKNWLNFNLSFKFDIIVGDNVTGMFPVVNYTQFFKNMHKYLQTDGLMIIRAMIQNKQFDISPQESIKNFRQIYKKMNIHIFTATHNNFALYYLDKHNAEYSMPFLAKKLVELYKEGLYTKDEYVHLIFYYANNTLTLSVPEEENLKKTLGRFFTIKAKEFGLDYLASYNNPIYVLSKKNVVD